MGPKVPKNPRKAPPIVGIIWARNNEGKPLAEYVGSASRLGSLGSVLEN